jgi:hypothetical protein
VCGWGEILTCMFDLLVDLVRVGVVAKAKAKRYAPSPVAVGDQRQHNLVRGRPRGTWCFGSCV